MRDIIESIARRLEYLRGELQAERISYGELAELQDLAAYIDPGDVELLEAAGVSEGACDSCNTHHQAVEGYEPEEDTEEEDDTEDEKEAIE